MLKNISLLTLTCILLSFSNSYGQGCSDAGFCTLNGIQGADDNHSIAKNSFSIGTAYGFADYGISVNAPFFSYNRSLGEKLSFNTRITSISQKSDSLKNSGLSDLFITTNYQVSSKIGVTAAIKLPLSDGNELLSNDRSLPLNFQPSLGTTDLIAGMAVSLKNIQLNFAIQQPITQTKNTFLSDVYDSTYYMSDFQSTNLLDRKGDVLIRGTYKWQINEKIDFSSSLLSIYHLGKDSFIDENNVKQTIEGSDGLTINLNLFFDYKLSDSSNLHISFASPLIVREIRPDGLTRSFISVLSYTYSF